MQSAEFSAIELMMLMENLRFLIVSENVDTAGAYDMLTINAYFGHAGITQITFQTVLFA